MNKYSERQKGLIALLLLAIIYGILPLIPRFLSTSFQLMQQVYLRIFAGFLISLFIFRKQINFGKILKMPLKEWTIIVLRAAIYYLFGVVLYTQALLLTKISNVVLIGAIPSTAVLGFIILREKATLPKLLLVLLSTLGVFIISVKNFSNLFSLGQGEVMALFSTFLASLGFISRRWHGKDLNDREISTLILFFAAFLIFLISTIKGEGLPVSNWNWGIFLALLLGGFLIAAISFLMNYGFSRVNAVLGSNIIATEPVFAIFFAFLVFRELPVVKEVLGGLFIVGSAIAMNKIENKGQVLV